MAVQVRTHCVLLAGDPRAVEPLATVLQRTRPEDVLRVSRSLGEAAEVLRTPPDLVLFGAGGDPAGQAHDLGRARSLWGVGVPVIAVLGSQSGTAARWYDLGVHCVLRLPEDREEALRAAEAALHYWLDVVALPGDWLKSG